jgi:hypothetical protein
MEFTNKDGGFWSGCVGLGAFVFYVGCGWAKKLVLHWAKFLKELGFNSLAYKNMHNTRCNFQLIL